MSNIPLAVISIRLSAMDISETPANSVFHSLVPWLKGNVVLIDIDFDIDHYEDNFNGRMARLVNKFETEFKQ